MSFLVSITCLCLLGTTVSGIPQSPEPLKGNIASEMEDLLYSLYVKAYNKQYSDKEYKERQTIFHKNVKRIVELQNQNPTAKFGVNDLTDWKEEEFKRLLGFVPSKDKLPLAQYTPKGDAPDAWDWREHGAVTEVKFQGACGSCFIFSAIGNIEGQYAIKHKKLVSLSEQQPLDCMGPDNTCHVGGDPQVVMQKLALYGGSEAESSYPYEMKVMQCRQNKGLIVAKVIDGLLLNITDEETLKHAVYEIGPISVSMKFTPQLRNYGGSVLIPTDCDDPHQTDGHALVIVGYGTDKESGHPYWLIKNSWGVTYGEKGYLRLIRGKNPCGFLGHLATATVA